MGNTLHIYLHERLILMVNLGEYTMDPMGYESFRMYVIFCSNALVAWDTLLTSQNSCLFPPNDFWPLETCKS